MSSSSGTRARPEMGVPVQAPHRRVGQPVWGGLGDEARTLWRTLREPAFLVLILTLFLLYALVLQRPFDLDLDVGAGPGAWQMNSFDHLVGQTFAERVGRPYDEVYLEGFFPSEQGGDFTFRWSEPYSASVHVAGVARGPVLLELRMHGAVSGPATTARLDRGGAVVAEFDVPYPLHYYSFALDPGLWPAGELDLNLRASPFLPGGDDPRALGVALDRMSVLGWAWGGWPGLPAASLCLASTAAFLYLVLRRAGLARLVVSAVTGVWGVLTLAALLLPARFFLATYAPHLLLAFALSYPLLVLTLAGARALYRRAGNVPDARTWRWLAVLFLAAFLLRFGGALSPRYASHDGPFHSNRLLFAERGDLFFEHHSIEAGMRSDPYPGALYVTLLPLTVVIRDFDGLLAFFLAWLGAGEVFLVWFLARQVSGAQSSLWAVLLYLGFPIGLAAYWFGIYANLFASWVVLVVAVALVLAWKSHLPASLLLWTPLFALLFLAHFGTVILWFPLLLLWGVVLYTRGGPGQRRRMRRLALAGTAGLFLAAVLYYSYFSGFFASMGTAVGGVLFPGVDASAGGAGFSVARALAEARVWWRWGVVADYAGVGLVLGCLGVWVLARRRWQSPVLSLLLLMLAVAVVFWGISMVTAYFTRYMLFLLPVAALGCGEMLSWWWRRGGAGRVLAIVVLSYTVAMTLTMWLGLCLVGLHPPHVL